MLGGRAAYPLIALLLVGCGTTSDYRRATEIDAQLPRAQGLGAFAPSCIFLCFVVAHFSHGDADVPALPEDASLQGKASTVRKKGVAP